MGAGSLHTEEYKQLCEKLKMARLEKGLTQQELADRLSKPQSYVAKYERAERRIDVIEYVKITIYLNIDCKSSFELLYSDLSRSLK